ncbi:MULTISPECIES: hypothetical protein [unclassified Nocardia]|uniref:hypothetical protein n=1 Tax=unclassified Nocardia TaxID=2637762 RepID=UPI00278C484A|nr:MULTISPECIES: hypothetical protein [unclassified Nocardia]
MGISFALTELADHLATGGEFAAAGELFEQAATVVAEVGAYEDTVRMRARQAQLYWLLGDADASGAALAEARRRAEQAAWPIARAELALAEAELARWTGDTERAHRQIDLATTMLGAEAEQPHTSAVIHELRGYLATDLDTARAHHDAAYRAATASGHVPLLARVLVGIGDLALRSGADERAVRLLAASTTVRGRSDRSLPDAARIEATARQRLGDARFTEALREGERADWQDLVAATLAS